MAFIGDFVKEYPLWSAATFAVGGGVGYGATHHFLDFEAPYALGAGAFVGSAVVIGQAYIDSLSIAGIVAGTLAPVTEPIAEATTTAVQGVGQGIASVGDALNSDTIRDAGGFLGGETATFDDKTGVQQSGNHELDTAEERAALMRLLMTKSGTKENDEARALLEQAIANAHRKQPPPQDEDPGADASFPTNQENAAPVFDINAHGAPDNAEERAAFGAILFASDKQAAYQRYINVAMQQHMAPSTTA